MNERTEREQAAQLIARESWPGERWENRRAWASRLIAEPGMAEEEVAHALARIEQRRLNVLAAAAVLAADPADWTEADYARRVAARDFPRPVASPDDTTP